MMFIWLDEISKDKYSRKGWVVRQVLIVCSASEKFTECMQRTVCVQGWVTLQRTVVLLHVIPTEFQSQDTCELQTAWSQATLLFLTGLSGYLTHASMRAFLRLLELSRAQYCPKGSRVSRCICMY